MPPLVQPLAFRVDTVVFVMPIDRARSIVTGSDPKQDTIAYRIDEQGLFARLMDLSGRDVSVRCVTMSSPWLVAGYGLGTTLTLDGPGSAAAGRLRMDEKVSLGRGWQAYDLQVGFTWTRGSTVVMRALPARTPMPPDLWLEFDMLPAASGDEHDARGLVGFVRAQPIWPETGDL